jgi:hypothetical protein
MFSKCSAKIPASFGEWRPLDSYKNQFCHETWGNEASGPFCIELRRWIRCYDFFKGTTGFLQRHHPVVDGHKHLVEIDQILSSSKLTMSGDYNSLLIGERQVFL